jgi:microcystin degradation protein MlrC
MTVDGTEDGEGDLLKAVRDALPEGTPIASTLDHHANVSQAMVDNSDFLVGYRTHPHVDQYQVGHRAAELLIDLIEKKPILKKSFLKLPLVTPAENRGEPVKAMAASIERIEKDPHVFTASFFVAYPWADVSIIGASVLVIADTEETAFGHARDLADQLWDLREDFRFDIYPIADAVRMGRETEGKPIVLDELSDCTLGGAGGDVVTSVRYLVEHEVKNAVVVGIVDPDAVRRAHEAGTGTELRLRIGGTITKRDNPPLDVAVRVTKLDENTSGRSDIHSGYETRLGKVAVVEKNGVEIVLIEFPGKIGGPSFLEALGIDPRQKDFIVSKEGLNPFVDYEGVASRILMVDTPGFDPQVLKPEDYHNVPRPIYPLDPDLRWDPDR